MVIIEKITDINWTWFVLHFVYEDANILQVLFNSVGNSSLLEVGDNLHAYLFILSSFPFFAVFPVFAHHKIYKNARPNGNTKGTVNLLI